MSKYWAEWALPFLYSCDSSWSGSKYASNQWSQYHIASPIGHPPLLLRLSPPKPSKHDTWDTPTWKPYPPLPLIFEWTSFSTYLPCSNSYKTYASLLLPSLLHLHSSPKLWVRYLRSEYSYLLGCCDCGWDCIADLQLCDPHMLWDLQLEVPSTCEEKCRPCCRLVLGWSKDDLYEDVRSVSSDNCSGAWLLLR